MTLNEAINLKQKGMTLPTQKIPNELNHNSWYTKHDGSSITGFQINDRIKVTTRPSPDGSKTYIDEIRKI